MSEILKQPSDDFQLYTQRDYGREWPRLNDEQPWRDPFYRDFGRVVHSPSFRRLQGKTQVFPGYESDFFRNRLTHSLEVAQIAEGIADRLNSEDPHLASQDLKISGRLCAVASLIHDLGHPPFGHNGERALDDAMRCHGGFEGNAQSLRIVSRLEKKVRSDDARTLGLGLCYRSLASILKYDEAIPASRRSDSKLVKGYYSSESNLVDTIKAEVAPGWTTSGGRFKTIECGIMDLADDIAYSTYDLEDCMKAGFLTPSKILCSSDRLLEEVSLKVTKQLGYKFSKTNVLKVFYKLFTPDPSLRTKSDSDLEDYIEKYTAYRDLASEAYLRTKLSSELVKSAINSVELTFNKQYPMLSAVNLSAEARERVEVLKQYTFISTIYSSQVKIPEFRGYTVVTGIFHTLAREKGDLLMPDDVKDAYDNAKGDLNGQMRVVSDFVAGMTDRYALEFYGRLHSDNAQSMFKPI